MNTPARFDSLLWMASPMLAWAQATVETPSAKASVAKPASAHRVRAPGVRRKRRKVPT